MSIESNVRSETASSLLNGKEPLQAFSSLSIKAHIPGWASFEITFEKPGPEKADISASEASIIAGPSSLSKSK